MYETTFPYMYRRFYRYLVIKLDIKSALLRVEYEYFHCMYSLCDVFVGAVAQ